jgi:iron complex outermembrane receptor protein
MQRRQLLGGTAMVAASSLFIMSSAMAQTAPTAAPATSTPSATALPEVLVTARARTEKLLDVPLSVQNFSADQLAEDKITSLDTLQYEAGFTFNSQGASFFGGGREFPTLVFRGMTSNYGAGLADSGALFVDGIFISGGAASVTLADASQVEVLKGPQNVYFGKNTFGGAVNLITSNPSEAYHASATVGYSDKGSYDDVASVEGAIIPGLLTGRVTGELLHQGAQYKAADGGPLGEEDTKGITAVLYATPNPDIWLKTRVHYSEDNDSEAADGFISGATYGTTCPGMVNPYLCNGIPSPSQVKLGSVLSGTTIPQALLTDIASNSFYGAPGLLLNKVPNEDKAGLVRDNLQGSLQGGAKLPFGATFQFSAGYNQQQSLDISSSDHTPENVFTTALPLISRDFEADARILTDANQPLRFVAGINYFRSIYQLVYDGDFFGVFANSDPVNERDETEAAYGSAEYDITSYLTLTGEIRYQRDTILDEALEGQPTTLITPVEKSYNHALPRVILKYHPDATTNVYLSYSEGVQPPQLQTSYITADSFEKAALSAVGGGGDYTSDPKIRVWEIGLKKSLFKNRVFFSVDYYNQWWDNALVETFLFNNPANGCSTLPTEGVSTTCPYPGGGAGAFSTSENHIQGVEFDGTARITPKWTAHAEFNYTDAIRKSYYDDSWGSAFTSGVVPSQDGKVIDLVPAYQASLDTTYKDHLVGPYDWYTHGVLNYTGDQYVEATDIAKIPGYFRLNWTAGITRGNLVFEAFVSNLLDDKHWAYAVRFPDPTFFFSEAHQGVIAAPENPRDFGFKVSAKF